MGLKFRLKQARCCGVGFVLRQIGAAVVVFVRDGARYAEGSCGKCGRKHEIYLGRTKS